ncbi:hypothetical protein BCR35DRAFT_300756 [Leucosporidium creatinivorum]|uniref:Cysteine-rich PDZ-binding protein n=1 Tax=Leucosporidium creatinivorum TaxID=106004 RepID=A0A1Y2FZL4_9BASI|nr:hypothetical protein BCR35DRAFT_300756 [Leucosporidium creatinivorum]
MPCAKCEKKLAAGGKSALACTDVWRPTGPGGDRNERKVGENKLLSAKSRYSPYAPAASTSKGGALNKSASGGKAAAAATFGKCETCKSTVARAGAKYCQACAYKKGICSMCSKSILDTSQYKMSSK